MLWIAEFKPQDTERLRVHLSMYVVFSLKRFKVLVVYLILRQTVYVQTNFVM